MVTPKEYADQRAAAESEEPVLPIHQDSDAALGVSAYWSPDVPPWEPIKELNSSLRIGAVVSDRLYDGLRFEGELFLLTPDNWRYTLKHGELDLLIIESTWETATGHWYLAQTVPGQAARQLGELIRYAQRLGVPAAYWFTEDRVYHEHYKEFASLFDHVFCADASEIDRLREEGISAEYLPPCVQPAVYNPFRHSECYDALDLGILFDGWADLAYHPYDYSVLDEIKREHCLSIIESRYQLTGNRLEAAHPHDHRILGCATRQTQILALKYARAAITFDQTLSTPTTQQWRALEATASYVPIVRLGQQLPNDDLRHDVIQKFDDQLDFLVELIRLEEDNLYRRRRAHRAWRTTTMQHTFSHRMRAICHACCIDHDWKEYPKISVIAPAPRTDHLRGCVETFTRQTYPHKELVLVFNGNDCPTYSNVPANHPAVEVLTAHVPGDRSTAAAMALGAGLAEGDYCFKVDASGTYSDNYVLDMMLHQRAVTADYFGKPLSPLMFESESELYVRNSHRAQPFMVCGGMALRKNSVWLGGSSVAFRDVEMRRSTLNRESFGDEEVLFNKNIRTNATVILTDPFNHVEVGRRDLSTQQWEKMPELGCTNSNTLPGSNDVIL